LCIFTRLLTLAKYQHGGNSILIVPLFAFSFLF